MKKICYFDTETTGTDQVKNDIVQFAYIIEIDDKIEDEGSIYIQPCSFENIEPEALQVNNLTIEQLKTFDEPKVAYNKIRGVFAKHIDKYDRSDKFVPAGYNVRFDMDFLRQFFLKNNDVYFGSWFNYHFIDPLQLLYWLEYIGEINLPDYKLKTVCEHFDIELEAHEALSDIKATRQLIKLLLKFLK